jgi:hypothetical protein
MLTMFRMRGFLVNFGKCLHRANLGTQSIRPGISIRDVIIGVIRSGVMFEEKPDEFVDCIGAYQGVVSANAKDVRGFKHGCRLVESREYVVLGTPENLSINISKMIFQFIVGFRVGDGNDKVVDFKGSAGSSDNPIDQGNSMEWGEHLPREAGGTHAGLNDSDDYVLLIQKRSCIARFGKSEVRRALNLWWPCINLPE